MRVNGSGSAFSESSQLGAPVFQGIPKPRRGTRRVRPEQHLTTGSGTPRPTNSATAIGDIPATRFSPRARRRGSGPETRRVWPWPGPHRGASRVARRAGSTWGWWRDVPRRRFRRERRPPSATDRDRSAPGRSSPRAARTPGTGGRPNHSRGIGPARSTARPP